MEKFEKEAIKLSEFLEGECGWNVESGYVSRCKKCKNATENMRDKYCSLCGTKMTKITDIHRGSEDIRQGLIKVFGKIKPCR